MIFFLPYYYIIQHMHNIIKRIDNRIRSGGIPKYVKAWKPEEIPDVIPDDIIRFLQPRVKSYHKHSNIIDTRSITNTQNIINTPNTQLPQRQDNPTYKLKWNAKNRIGTIVLNPELTKNDADKIRNEVVKWDANGIVIDLRRHTGGNLWIYIAALQDILGNTTLMSFTSGESWINLVGGKIQVGKFLTSNLSFNGRIAVLVGPKTASAGEFIAALFMGRKNARIFGKPTGGYLSVNREAKIGDFILVYTSSLCTTVDNITHTREVIIPYDYDKAWIHKRDTKI